MREDRVTPTPDAAAAWERHRSPEVDDHADGITPEDGEAYGDPFDCGGCEEPACLVCAFGRLYGGAR